jgi:hypothetical protein
MVFVALELFAGCSAVGIIAVGSNVVTTVVNPGS